MKKHLLALVIICITNNLNAQFNKLLFDNNTATNFMEYNNTGQLNSGLYADNGSIGKVFLSGTRNNLSYGQGGEIEFDGGYGTRANILMKYTGGHEQTWLGITSSDSNFPLKVGIGTNNPNSPLTLGYNNGSNQIAFKRADGKETFSTYINSTGQIIFQNTSGGGDYDFRSNIGGQAMASTLFIEGTNGKIGIGTTIPDMKLTVKGNIHAEEVKIDLSVPAPDYVFKENYYLRSIEEVEKFIKENSHLPEIPSAKEFEQNGVMQAEMDMNLLKKIEELTLYTIQQQKEIEKLKTLVKQLVESKK